MELCLCDMTNAGRLYVETDEGNMGGILKQQGDGGQEKVIAMCGRPLLKEEAKLTEPE